MRQLEAFTLVFRLGSVSQAAARMSVTQSTVSVLLRQLEQNVGALLFDRTTRVMSSTEVARELLPFAERTLREVDQLQQRVDALLRKSGGQVRFAASAAVAASVLPDVIGLFAAAYPDVAIQLQDTAPGSLERVLLDGDVDFIVSGWPEETSPELQYDLLKSGYLIAARARDGSNIEDTLTWRALLDQPRVIGVRRASTIRKRIDRQLEPLGLRFAPTLEAELLSTVIALTLEGLGVAVLPEDLIAAKDKAHLHVQRLVHPEVRHDLVLTTRPELSLPPAAEAFVSMLQRHLRTFPAQSGEEPFKPLRGWP